MGWFKPTKQEKERQRFYLLPGMGGRALRRKQRTFLKWSIAVAIVASGVLAFLLYMLNTSRR